MPSIFKRTVSGIVRRWNILAWSLLALLLMCALSLALPKFPALANPAAIAIAVFLIALLWLFPKLQVRSVVVQDDPKDYFNRENEARKTLSQILGGLALLIGFYFTWQNLSATQENLRISSEGQITDRFTKAVSQLGDSRFEVWLGGVYALERIAKDSPRDHWSIMEILTSYVREHAKISAPWKTLPRNEARSLKAPPDIQAILTVIGRRELTYRNGEYQPLDLHQTDLRGANLFKANLAGAFLDGADLSGARLSGSEPTWLTADVGPYSGATLREASLRGANLSGANLSGVDFTGAHLEGANLSNADLRWARLDLVVLHGAILDNGNLNGANLRTVEGLLPAQLESAHGGSDTQLPPNISRPKSWQ